MAATPLFQHICSLFVMSIKSIRVSYSTIKAPSVEGFTKLLLPDLFCSYGRFGNETWGMYTDLFDSSLLNA